MPSNRNYVVKNSKLLACSNCSGVHDYLTLISEDAPCDTPAVFSHEVATNMAKLKAKGTDDVALAPDDTIVVMHPSARKLPVMREAVLAQYTSTEVLM